MQWRHWYCWSTGAGARYFNLNPSLIVIAVVYLTVLRHIGYRKSPAHLNSSSDVRDSLIESWRWTNIYVYYYYYYSYMHACGSKEVGAPCLLAIACTNKCECAYFCPPPPTYYLPSPQPPIVAYLRPHPPMAASTLDRPSYCSLPLPPPTYGGLYLRSTLSLFLASPPHTSYNRQEMRRELLQLGW